MISQFSCFLLPILIAQEEDKNEYCFKMERLPRGAMAASRQRRIHKTKESPAQAGLFSNKLVV